MPLRAKKEKIMQNFWDYSVWGFILLIGTLLFSLLLANLLKKSFKFLKNSLIPTSVLGGIILLIVSLIYNAIVGENLFNAKIFGGNGVATLEIITYHALALGFICTTYRNVKARFNHHRKREIFDTGVTTVATYLLQGILGLGITIVISLVISDFFPAAGILLPFGYGQGSGQALNYGNIYENLPENPFVGGKSFGLSIAALGFLSASIGGVIYLNVMKRKGRMATSTEESAEIYQPTQIQTADEIPMNGSIDKLTVQLAIMAVTYVIAYLVMFGLGELLPVGLKSVIYGFNFLFGVLIATLIKNILAKLHEKNVVKKQYVNGFLMSRISGFFFDIMIVAGIAAIEISVLAEYWWILLLLGVVGLVSTYFYEKYIAKKLFPAYADEQFLAMYGMLTGTASTGMILLREVDSDFKSPVSDNMVYQNLPAIVFGFPMMLLATLAPKKPVLTLIILVAFFIVMNVILFRRFIFKSKKGFSYKKAKEKNNNH